MSIVESKAALPQKYSAAARALARVGWEIREADINMATGKATLRLFRADGRWLHLSADERGGAVERWRRDRPDQRGMGGVGPMFHGLTDTFLGRTRCASAVGALRFLCTYVADNPAPHCAPLPASEVRDAIRLLMT